VTVKLDVTVVFRHIGPGLHPSGTPQTTHGRPGATEAVSASPLVEAAGNMLPEVMRGAFKDAVLIVQKHAAETGNEMLVGIDAKGGIVGSVMGDNEKVGLGDLGAKGAVAFVHSHPRPGGPSGMDLGMFLWGDGLGGGDMAEGVIDSNGTIYTLTRDPAGHSDISPLVLGAGMTNMKKLNKLSEEWNNLRFGYRDRYQDEEWQKLESQRVDSYSEGKFSHTYPPEVRARRDEMVAEETDYANKKMAKKLGLIYRVFGREVKTNA